MSMMKNTASDNRNRSMPNCSFVFIASSVGLAPVREVRMLPVPKRTTAPDWGQQFKVVNRRRGRRRPFQCPALPWIIRSVVHAQQADKDIHEKCRHREKKNERTDRRQQIQQAPVREIWKRIDRSEEHTSELQSHSF